MVVVQVVLQSALVHLACLLVLQKHLLDPDLLQDGRKLVVMEKVDHGVLWQKEKVETQSDGPIWKQQHCRLGF